MHSKRPMNDVIPLKPPAPPFNVEACLVECHCEFRSTLIRGRGGGGGKGREQAIQWHVSKMYPITESVSTLFAMIAKRLLSVAS